MNDDFSEFSGYASDDNISEENFFVLPEEVKVPAYTSLIYGNVYNNLENSSKLDTVGSARKRTFYQYQKLINSMLREVKMNQSVLQMGLTFGNEIDQVAQRIGAYGQFDVIDVNPLQVSRNKEKYGNIYPAMNIWNYDAAEFKFEKNMTRSYAFSCFRNCRSLPKAKSLTMPSGLLKKEEVRFSLTGIILCPGIRCAIWSACITACFTPLPKSSGTVR